MAYLVDVPRETIVRTHPSRHNFGGYQSMPFSKVSAHIYVPISLLQEHLHFADWAKLPNHHSVPILAVKFEEIPFIFWDLLLFRLHPTTSPVMIVVFVIVR
jgi:hypothetical protein